jgi:hypothetical protein
VIDNAILHDASLLELRVDWQRGSVTVPLIVVGEEFDINVIATGLRELTVPHAKPWGRSEYVDSVVGPVPVGDGLQRVTIGMQSGDEIQIDARQIEFVKVAPSGTEDES